VGFDPPAQISTSVYLSEVVSSLLSCKLARNYPVRVRGSNGIEYIRLCSCPKESTYIRTLEVGSVKLAVLFSKLGLVHVICVQKVGCASVFLHAEIVDSAIAVTNCSDFITGFLVEYTRICSVETGPWSLAKEKT
jgi:hypothetical protein